MSVSTTRNPVGISTNADMIDGDLVRFAGQLEAVARSGADTAEIILHSLDVVVNGKLDAGILAKVKRITSSFHLSYSIHLPFILNLLDHECLDSYTDVFRAGLRFAGEIGATAVVYHSSIAKFDAASLSRYYQPRYGTVDPQALSRVLFEEDAQRLSALADEAASFGVRIGVENPNPPRDLTGLGTYGFSPPALVEHVRRIGKPNLGVTLDFGHLYLASLAIGFDYLQAVKTLAPHAVHAHVHDNFGKPDAGEPYIQRLPYGLGDLHLPPGMGLLPLDSALPILLSAGFDGVLMLEIEFRFFPDFPSHVADFRQRIKSYRS